MSGHDLLMARIVELEKAFYSHSHMNNDGNNPCAGDIIYKIPKEAQLAMAHTVKVSAPTQDDAEWRKKWGVSVPPTQPATSCDEVAVEALVESVRRYVAEKLGGSWNELSAKHYAIAYLTAIRARQVPGLYGDPSDFLTRHHVEIANLKAQLESMTKTAAAHAAASTETQAECDQLSADLAATKNDLAASRACNVGASAKWEQMESELARVAELENALDATHKRFSEEAGNVYQLRSDLARVTAERDALKLDNDLYLEGSEDARAACDKLTAELAEAKALLGAYPHDGWTQKVRDYLHGK